MRRHQPNRVEHHHSNPWMAIGWVCLGGFLAFAALAFLGLLALLGAAH